MTTIEKRSAVGLYIHSLTQIMVLCNGDFRNKNRSATGLCGIPETAPAAKNLPETAPLSIF